MMMIASKASMVLRISMMKGIMMVVHQRHRSSMELTRTILSTMMKNLFQQAVAMVKSLILETMQRKIMLLQKDMMLLLTTKLVTRMDLLLTLLGMKTVTQVLLVVRQMIVTALQEILAQEEIILHQMKLKKTTALPGVLGISQEMVFPSTALLEIPVMEKTVMLCQYAPGAPLKPVLRCVQVPASTSMGPVSMGVLRGAITLRNKDGSQNLYRHSLPQ